MKNESSAFHTFTHIFKQDALSNNPQSLSFFMKEGFPAHSGKKLYYIQIHQVQLNIVNTFVHNDVCEQRLDSNYWIK